MKCPECLEIELTEEESRCEVNLCNDCYDKMKNKIAVILTKRRSFWKYKKMPILVKNEG